jgi:hypothetical protein
MLMGDIRGAPHLNNQSNRVSILRVRTSKDRCLDRSIMIPGTNPDRSAKLWIIAEPANGSRRQQRSAIESVEVV